MRILVSLLLPFLTACQLGYIAESAYYQGDLMRRRVPLKYALKHYKLTDDQRRKIEMTIKVREFMKNDLGLDTDSNYLRYVHLERDYVTYAVSAAQKTQLKAYQWDFPIVGKVPYKGFFKKESALEEVEDLKEEGLDVYMRGVAAYSTLGWFEDPLLSSMLRMRDHHFINTLIHETVHANLYISDHSKFNERVASFLGQLGTEAYYEKMGEIEKLNSIVKKESHDELLFSEFMGKEVKDLKAWYKANEKDPNILEKREEQFSAIKQRFAKDVKPKLKTKNYNWFEKRKMNNASILLLALYNSDFGEFEVIANRHGRSFQKTFSELKKLEDSDDPEADLKKMATTK